MSRYLLMLGLCYMLACSILLANSKPVMDDGPDLGPIDVVDAKDLEEFITPIDFARYKNDPCSDEAIGRFAGRSEEIYKHLDELTEERIFELVEPITQTKVRSQCAEKYGARVDELLKQFEIQQNGETEE